MAIEPKDNNSEKTKSYPDDDWENCKGQCGYTLWCKDCKTLETKK